jgi:hypothetical protein
VYSILDLIFMLLRNIYSFFIIYLLFLKNNFIMNFNILLFVYENDKKLQKIRLEEGEYTVGKDKSCEIVIKDE